MIHILPQDTIIDIIEKIEKHSGKNISLSFPVGHPIIHNHLSLKIIQAKCKDTQLKIYTSDIIGKKICKNIGISIGKEKSKEQAMNIMNHNFTAKEYLLYLGKQYKKEFIEFIRNHQKINQISNYSHSNPQSFKFFLIAFLFSILLFCFVYYIAISKTTVIISPETSIRKEALNFILDTKAESSILGNNNTIKIESLTEKFYSSETYSATSIKYTDDSTAGGNIIITNNTIESIAFKPNTRFQTEDGIVFTADSWVQIPGGTIDGFGKISPGTLNIKISANIKDAQGKIIGARGNIKGGTKLIIPGLSEENQALIYAESIEDFSGGSNKIVRIISEEDLESTRELFIEKLKRDAYENLKSKINIYNSQNGTKREILVGNDFISYQNINVQLEDGIEVGSEQNNFSYSGDITISAMIYNADSIIQKLQTVVNEKNLDPYEKIQSINKESLRLSEIISIQNNKTKIKATFEIEALKYYDISKDNQDFSDSIKIKIKGKKIQDAENILINDPKISTAKIINRPFFIETVSSIMNNIIIKVQL